MASFVKILSGTTATANADNWQNYVDLVYTDERPGDDYYPEQKSGQRPTPGPYQQLWFTWTLNQDEGIVYKTYFLKSLRVFSKLKVIENLMKEGLWAQAKAIIEQAGLYDLFLAAQNFREDNEFFDQGVGMLKQQLGVSDEKTEEILRKSIVD